MGFFRRKIAPVEVAAVAEPEPEPEPVVEPVVEPEPIPVVKGTHRWVFHLESADGREFRRTSLAAETEHEARDIVVRRELEKCAYRLSPAQWDASFERGAAGKAQRLTHEQAEPYRIVKVEEL